MATKRHGSDKIPRARSNPGRTGKDQKTGVAVNLETRETIEDALIKDGLLQKLEEQQPYSFDRVDVP